MNCDYCKDKLSAYIDNELSSKERLLIEKHLKTCTSCKQEAETLKQLGVIFERLPEETPSSVFVRTTVKRAASIPRRSFWNELFLNPAISFVRSVVTFVFVPDGNGAVGGKNLSSQGYLRTFDDSPPGSFADVYLTVIQGGGN